MSLPVTNPKDVVIDTIADLKQRVRILEATVPPGVGSSTVLCTGCYEIPAEFAECAELTPGDCLDIAENTYLTTPSPDPVSDSDIPVGPYLCNWLAGFRVQCRYVGLVDGLQTDLWCSVGHDPSTPPSWTVMPTPNDLVFLSPVTVDTGWVTVTLNPTGVGSNGDPWTAYLGITNQSILFPAQLGDGQFCTRYLSVADLANDVPQPQNEGQILVSLGTPPVWTALDAGTVGQVLTIGAGGIPEWA